VNIQLIDFVKNNLVIIKKTNLVSLFICMTLSIVMINGSAITMSVFAQTRTQPDTLPICTDPTGQNLPCFMVISTLPPPANAIHCQESSGQILACSYATQTLSNGQGVMVITVYVPASFVLSQGIVKVISHENKVTRTIREEPRGIGIGMPSPVCRGIQGIHGCIVFLPGAPGQPPFPIYLTPLPPGPHTAGFRLGWFYGNTGSDYYNPYPPESKDWLAFNFGLNQGFNASTPYTNCEHFDTCSYPKFDPTKDPRYKPQLLPTPCVSPEGIDYCSNRATMNPLGLLLPSHGNSSQTESIVGNHSLPSISTPLITNVSNTQTGGKKEAHVASCANNCTSTSHTIEDCSTSPNLTACRHQNQQQQHTAAYLQALNSGSPNPYKPGTKDYEHYQAGIAAREQNKGGGASSGNTNNNSSPNNTPSSGGGTSNDEGSMGGSNDNNNGGHNVNNDNTKENGGSSSGSDSGASGRTSTSSKMN
jgi:hypothetical protein